MRAFVLNTLCALVVGLAAPASRADVGRDQAAAAAQAAVAGRVLSIDRAQADRRPVWRVKILTGRGEVRVIVVDAESGRVVG